MDKFQPYELVLIKADQIEAELKRLNRWSDMPPPQAKFVEMGAFGQNTMAFEEWLQFVLIPRIHAIIAEKGDFPEDSMLASYAVRVFDGNPETDELHQLLYDLDILINKKSNADEPEWNPLSIYDSSPTNYAVPETFLSTQVPPVVLTLAELLHGFEGDDLENQLQTYDIFLYSLAPMARPKIAELLVKASGKATNPTTKSRIERAAQSVLSGGRAAEPYDHENAMKKYRDDHLKPLE